MVHYLWRPGVTKRTAAEAKLFGDGAVQSARMPGPAIRASGSDGSISVSVSVSVSSSSSSSSSRGSDSHNGSAFFHALRVLLGDREGGRWLRSTRELQRVCFETCGDCRESVPLRLHVSAQTPEHLWKRDASTDTSGRRASGGGGSCFEGGSDLESDIGSYTGSSRDTDLDSAMGSDSDGDGGGWSLPLPWKIQEPSGKTKRPAPGSYHFGSPPRRNIPPPRIVSMVWERRTLAEASFGPDLAEIIFGAAVVDPLQGLTWNPGLTSITLTSNWNLPPLLPPPPPPPPPPPSRGWEGGNEDDDVSGSIWPPSLEEVVLGREFDQPVDRVAWPSSLQRLTFGERFNHRIDGVRWPASLLRLAFRGDFNQSIEDVAWPPSLQQLTLGVAFDLPVCGVTWPPRLKRLVFGARFNQDVRHLPPSLEQLVMGYSFNHRSVVTAALPPGLKELTFGHDFDVDVGGVVWPATLELLAFGFAFNRAIDRVVWPPSLRELTFGHCFDRPIEGVPWPASLRRLSFGFAFLQPLHGGVLPAGLTHLSLDRWYPLSRRGLPRGVRVELA